MDKPNQSINKARSFNATANKNQILGQLIINLESLLKKMRINNMRCSKIHVTLRDSLHDSFSSHIKLHTLSRGTEMLHNYSMILLDELFDNNRLYRYVSVTLSGLQHGKYVQSDLFGESQQENKKEILHTIIDILDAKFGKQCLIPANALQVPKSLGSHISKQKNLLTKMYSFLPKETYFRRLAYPYMGFIN